MTVFRATRCRGARAAESALAETRLTNAQSRIAEAS